MTANEASALLMVPLAEYCAAEAGNNDHVLELVKERFPLPRPSPAEACLLARRRAGATVEEICRALGGISKPTFFSREREGNPEIIDLWRSRGFSF